MTEKFCLQVVEGIVETALDVVTGSLAVRRSIGRPRHKTPATPLFCRNVMLVSLIVRPIPVLELPVTVTSQTVVANGHTQSGQTTRNKLLSAQLKDLAKEVDLLLSGFCSSTFQMCSPT